MPKNGIKTKLFLSELLAPKRNTPNLNFVVLIIMVIGFRP